MPALRICALLLVTTLLVVRPNFAEDTEPEHCNCTLSLYTKNPCQGTPISVGRLTGVPTDCVFSTIHAVGYRGDTFRWGPKCRSVEMFRGPKCNGTAFAKLISGCTYTGPQDPHSWKLTCGSASLSPSMVFLAFCAVLFPLLYNRA
eukprot:TRINITY_DN67238_c1_g1_i1.p1 TRINITY_DN67238_c1_g1~~TRINITY_DN67238_c1_g1_i1.p1  ORF type:complete len:154 (-),score=3.74 TRINITY_DN67238_c1_g1_i1:208-645(-)